VSETQSRSSPLVAIAAIAVIIFSIVGVGVMTGYIPSSRSTPESSQGVAPPPAAPAQPAPVQAAPEPRAPMQVAPAQPAPQPPKATRQASPEPRVARAPAAAPSQPAYDSRPAQPATRPYDPAYDAPRVASAPPAICTNCGSVEAINVIEQKGEGSGLGAVAGGVAGGLLGNQVGRGTGRTVATIAGAAGGAYAGHQVEKHVKSGKSYEVVVRMEDGGTRRFPYEAQPAFRVGDRVRVVEGALVAN
jgi:outer membrane lipoprotein SlyB